MSTEAQEKDNFWLIVAGTVLAVIVTVVVIKSSEHEKYETSAKAIAEEWVTNLRLEHVLQKFPADVSMESMGDIIRAMIEDVYREGKGEIVESKEASKAIGNKAVQLFKQKLNSTLK